MKKHLKKYQSTTIVSALQINSVKRTGRLSGDATLTFVDKDEEVILDDEKKDAKGKKLPLEVAVPKRFLTGRQPVKGDYYVEDENGNVTFLSPDDFENTFSAVVLDEEE